MSAKILDGKTIAAELRAEIAKTTAQFCERTGIVPCLAAILVGEDPASQVYVRNKQKACEKAGIQSRLERLPANTDQDALLNRIGQLNEDSQVHGILVQLPLPDSIQQAAVLDAVAPHKDVDAFHPENAGLLSQGRPRFLPCTPHGIQQLLHRSQIHTAGRHIVVLGRSEIVGKPMALMLMQRDSTTGPDTANATVTVCHSRTPNLAEITRQADILIVAIGRPNFLTVDMIQPGAVIIDVGINRTDEGLVGDVDFDAVSQIAGHITPVPGGVGPLTIAMVLYNTLAAAMLSEP